MFLFILQSYRIDRKRDNLCEGTVNNSIYIRDSIFNPASLSR